MCWGEVEEFEARIRTYRQFLLVGRRAIDEVEATTNDWRFGAEEALPRGEPLPPLPDPERQEAGDPTYSDDPDGVVHDYDNFKIDWEEPRNIFLEEGIGAIGEMLLLLSMQAPWVAISESEVLLTEILALASHFTGRPVEPDLNGRKSNIDSRIEGLVNAGMRRPLTQTQRDALWLTRNVRNDFTHDQSVAREPSRRQRWLMPNDEFDVSLISLIALDIVEAASQAIVAAFAECWRSTTARSAAP